MKNGRKAIDIGPERLYAADETLADHRGVDPNYAGYQVLAEAYERAYEALPPEQSAPFEAE